MTAAADAGSTLEGLSWPVLGGLAFVALCVVLFYAIWLEEHDKKRRTLSHDCLERAVVADDDTIRCDICGRRLDGNTMPEAARIRVRDNVLAAARERGCRHYYRPVLTASDGTTWQCQLCGATTVTGRSRA